MSDVMRISRTERPLRQPPDIGARWHWKQKGHPDHRPDGLWPAAMRWAIGVSNPGTLRCERGSDQVQPSGDGSCPSQVLRSNDAFDLAMTDLPECDADQNERTSRDRQRRSNGRIVALEGV